MAVRTTLKKWGNSYGVVIPKEVAQKEGLREGDEVEVVVRRAGDIKSLFGKYKFDDVQAVKDGLREGWGPCRSSTTPTQS